MTSSREKPFGFAALIMAVAVCAVTRADESLHQRIDKLIEEKADGLVNPLATDAEFLRRVYLDLAGRIPKADEASQFFDDEAADKRFVLIDKLLAGDEYPRRMRELFHVMLLERRGSQDEWTKFLQSSFESNKAWDQMVGEMLNPNAADEVTRGAAYFYTSRLEKYGQNPTDYPGLVRDVGRLFLGVDVQCAQCHDHLFIEDYKQVDYQGLFAFLGTAMIRRDVQFPAVSEKPLKKKVEFMSVFDMQQLDTGPRLPFSTAIEVPEFKAGEEYLTPPDKKTRAPGVLKFSPLKILAEQLPREENDGFKNNIVNRLWWVTMGRGLVDPLDLHSSENPPSHPELLQLLADEFAAHQFDIKWLLRELALSKTYQRSGLLPDGESEQPAAMTFRVALERPLSAEQILRSTLLATGELERVVARKKPAEESEEPVDPTFDEIQEQFLSALANPPREPEIEFSPTVKASLFLSNDDVVLSWLQPRDGNLVDRLSKLDNANAIADELYLTVLTRKPTADERSEAVNYISSKGERRAAAIGNLVWALLTSTEFSVNH